MRKGLNTPDPGAVLRDFGTRDSESWLVMQRKMFCTSGLAATAVSCAFFTTTLHAGVTPGPTVDNFDDLAFVVGEGDSLAAFVVDWDAPGVGDAGHEALAWGYRFDGAPTVEDMLTDVTQADGNLFAKLSPAGQFGVSVYGLGYDADGDGFAITDGTDFGPGGVAVTVPPADATAVDADDNYIEGFGVGTAGFWALYLGEGNPYADGMWESALVGISGATLTDGGWFGLRFAPDFSGEPPRQPLAAIPAAPSVALLALAGGLAARRRRGLTAGATA